MKLTKWDPVDYLETPQDAAAYLNAALELGDRQTFVDALGDVARAKSLGKIAKTTGLSRESLYRSLSAAGNPQFSTVERVLDALGLALRVEPKEGAQASEPEAPCASALAG